MTTVAEVLRCVAPAYLQQYQERMPLDQRKVLGLIVRCRTGQLGTVSYRCDPCKVSHCIGRSCGNRHCPECQEPKSEQWLQKQSELLLPVPYFMVTFTVPAHLRRFIRSHPRECYEAMFRASSETLRTLMADPRHVGAADTGFMGVLHTWGRTLEYHPHVHYIVPGGGLTADRQQWISGKAGFLIPVKAASKIYRFKFKEEMARVGLLEKIDPGVWSKAWVVHCQAAGDGKASLNYLSAYVYKVAIGNHRIVAHDPKGPEGGRVTFKYKRKSGERHWRQMTISGFEFARRFLQHILPSGFRKVRYFGFMTQARRSQYQHVSWLAHLAQKIMYVLTSLPEPVPKPQICCPECGAAMRLISVVMKPYRPEFDDDPAIRPPPIKPESAHSTPEQLAATQEEWESIFLPSKMRAILAADRARRAAALDEPTHLK